MNAHSISMLRDGPADEPVGLYVHVPFCKTRCAFCAFYLQIHREDRVDRFLRALGAELAWHARHESLRNRRIGTVYFGGGTPTTLSGDQLVAVVDKIRGQFPVEPDAETTVEAHPETVTMALLHHLHEHGVTRLSLGAESMDQAELLGVGRPSLPCVTLDAVAMARDAGFRNINLDLMYGLPGQGLRSWTATLEAVLALDPAHLSCYALTVEEGTALADDISRGTVEPPDSSLQTELELAAETILAAAGYHRYELSNYAKPGFECRHNLLYWNDGDYLGLGPSAESYLDGVRFGNVADLGRYADLLERGGAPIDHREVLTPDQRRREALVFGLRRLAGVDRRLVEILTEDERWRAALDNLVRDDCLLLTDTRVRLTPKGRQLADSVSLQLI